jgi:mRNA-degrading endonuclease toxin of MazEF toxin-antitoxin module
MRYQFGDVVLVPFPFTDQSTTKQRPGVIVSSAAYHEARRNLILMAVTSQVRRRCLRRARRAGLADREAHQAFGHQARARDA